ncbi:hypothetical protein [Halalkalibacter okhensis]|uniref:Uncharacterized protein n=1 Tax=Halalkalibacter okhensis TaxID=333138 RepID=A0A0B0I9T1_9BACI|nr:hypothetical protein [Halalkalibacter okhensis]KHF39293.1 hypothetical protein LQ50_16485 [Halalkalibacter okhensis]
MKELVMEINYDRSRLLYLVLSIVAALLFMFGEGAFLFFLLSLVLLAKSKVEKADNQWLRISGVITYLLYFSYIAYQVAAWFYENFLG